MMRPTTWILLFGFCVTSCYAAQTEYFDITTVIQNHFAESTLESKILNDGNASAEVGFQIMLPREAFITHFEMVIDGVVYEGVIEEKEKAKKKYDAAKRRGHTAGLVATREKADKIFKTSVNIGANTAVEFKLVYQQLLRKVGGKYTNKIILFGDQLSRVLTINVYICETRTLTNVTVPPILLNGGHGTVDIDASVHVDGNTAQVSFSGNDELLNSAVSAQGGVFTVEYELEKSLNAAEVIVDNGYFIYFGPDIEVKPKRIIFVLDDSGSMGGSHQVKRAMTNILGKLLPLDRIGVVKFSTTTRTWRPTLVDATPENIQSAVAYVNTRDESSGTQIWDGLHRGLTLMKEDTIEEEVEPAKNMIILLSDGQGSLGHDQLLRNAAELGEKKYTIHTISFGSSADDVLLKDIANENHGRWKKILTDLDAALQIENYVSELRASTLSQLRVENYPTVIAETLPAGSFGSEIMSVGKFHDELDLYDNGPHEIAYGGFPGGDGIVSAQFFLDQEYAICTGMEGKEIENFAAKTFAMTKVEMALKNLEAETDSIQKEYYKQKAVNLSIEYKLVTPVTALLVIKPETEKEIEEEVESNLASTTTAPTTTRPRRAKQSRGGGGPRWSLHSDPHFVARISNDITVCFNWRGRDNEAVNLFHDAENSIVINALMKGADDGSLTKRLYVTELVVILERDELFVQIDPDGFIVGDFQNGTKGRDQVRISLKEIDQRSLVFGILKFHVAEIKKYHVILKIKIRKIVLVVELQYQREWQPGSRDHLDLAIPNYETNSKNLGGIFGHLQMRNFIDIGQAHIVHDDIQNKTFLLYNEDRVEVRKTAMRIPYMKANVDCWFTTGHLQNLLGSKVDSFALGSLTEIPHST